MTKKEIIETLNEVQDMLIDNCIDAGANVESVFKKANEKMYEAHLSSDTSLYALPLITCAKMAYDNYLYAVSQVIDAINDHIESVNDMEE